MLKLFFEVLQFFLTIISKKNENKNFDEGFSLLYHK